MAPDDDEDDYALPLVPTEEEARLAAQLGPDGVRAIDASILRHVKVRRASKVAAVLYGAMKAGGYLPGGGEACLDLHLRRVIALVESGVLVGQGNLRRPRFSEVYAPE